jgi:Xaa-Pro aminopeptidase
MPEKSLVFPAAEFRARIAALQREMARHDLDALLLTTPADVFYTTGFLTRFWESPARPWFVVVPCRGRSGCGDSLHWRRTDGALLDFGRKDMECARSCR